MADQAVMPVRVEQWRVGMLQSVWSFRSFIGALVFQEFRDRSARTLWGHAWMVIEPAVQIGIYVLIFSSRLSWREGSPGLRTEAIRAVLGLENSPWRLDAELRQFRVSTNLAPGELQRARARERLEEFARKIRVSLDG